MAKRTFRSVFKGLEHPMSIFRPAWTQANLCACVDLHGVRKYDGSNVEPNYFIKSKGLWHGWKS